MSNELTQLSRLLTVATRLRELRQVARPHLAAVLDGSNSNSNSIENDIETLKALGCVREDHGLLTWVT